VTLTFFEILEGWGYFKYFGMAISNEDWRMKKLRGNEFAEMQTAAS
jgi:hypothetical protein